MNYHYDVTFKKLYSQKKKKRKVKSLYLKQ